MRLPIAVLLCLIAVASQAPAFVHARSGAGQPLRRRDVTNIQYLINDKTAPGLNNSNGDRKSTRLNSSHIQKSRMPSSA